MDAIFLNEKEKTVKKIFLPKEVERRLSDLSYIPYVDRDEVLEKKDLYKDVKYIFSTWGMPKFSEEEIRKYFPSLQAIFYGAGTVKYFAEPFFNCTVRIFSAAKANAIPVAEYVVSQIILANKGYFQAEREMKKCPFPFIYNKAHDYSDRRPGNYQARVGLIGLGVIGKMVLERLQDYKIEVLVCDPFYTKEQIASLGGKKAELPEIFETCDVISNHLPNIEKTVDMLDYSLFSKMKSYATFLNTGRGAQVKEADLVKAMKEDKTRLAILDVTREEPLKWYSPLHFQKNILLTPHIAGSLSREVERMGEYMYDAYDDFISGKESPYEVTKDMLENMA